MSLKLNNNSTSGLMVKLAVAIGQLRVRFAASAIKQFLFASSLCIFFLRRGPELLR